MGEVVYDLKHQLQSMPEITPEEKSVGQKCLIQSVTQVTLGTVVASGLTWIATRRLGSNFQRSLSGGAGAIAGYWSLKNAVFSSVEQILALEGTRTQMEFATSLMGISHNPKVMQMISKHFYAENFYDDSTSDQPKLRWRYRTSWFDNNAKSQSTQDREYQSDRDNYNSDNNQSDTEAKQVPRNSVHSATVLMADPYDCIFGQSTTNEDSGHSETYSVPPTVMNRNHKRSRRRRRLQRQHESQSMKS